LPAARPLIYDKYILQQEAPRVTTYLRLREVAAAAGVTTEFARRHLSRYGPHPFRTSASAPLVITEREWPEAVRLLQSKTRREQGYVYFARSGDLVKIGHAVDFRRRLAQLQVGSPNPLQFEALIHGTAAEEASLHGRFASLRERGEWFRREAGLAAMLDYIATSDTSATATARVREWLKRNSKSPERNPETNVRFTDLLRSARR